MSAEMMTVSQEEPRISIAKKIKTLSDEEFLRIYATLLNITGTNRHSNPEIQIRFILEIEWDELELIIESAIAAIRRKDE